MALTDKERKMRKSVGMSPNHEDDFIIRRPLLSVGVSTLAITIAGYTPRVVQYITSYSDGNMKRYGDENPGCHIDGFDPDSHTGLPCPGGYVEPRWDNSEKGFFEDTSEMLAWPLGAFIVSLVFVYTYKAIRQSGSGLQTA